MKSKKVLIVDDNALNRRVFEHIIGQVYIFDIAENGKAAIEKLKSNQFDLVLMDIQMPVMDGISALEIIKRDQIASCPIIAISAYADQNDREYFLSTGFDDFISKPIKPKTFLETISNQIEKKAALPLIKEQDEIVDLELDTKILLQLLKYNSPENIKLVYDEFIEEAESLLSEIEPLIHTEKIKGIGDKLHIIKGNSGTLGAMKIFNSVKQFEKNIKNNIFDNTLKEYLTLVKLIASFKKHIKTIQAFNS
ncbi:CheY-like receiver domain-containing protein [Belliella baltica DSM 15883]|uniref:CheY-like receiver domain-containing protein n=1 Tax=Belliella baltica (strain DSM 15883 / CIP 108006 / LMG 21964 / BA134) TaxID=866536 RepID=I3Z9G2_BELBD|nr:response regulator [Belliella baltica]AFL85880.1 CheY-like receiver domain-containing protein [Belliella baltica DSM 15883]